MSERVTRINLKLETCPLEARAAHESAVILAKFGIKLAVFSDQERMNSWLTGVRKIHGLSVRVLESKEEHHG